MYFNKLKYFCTVDLGKFVDTFLQKTNIKKKLIEINLRAWYNKKRGQNEYNIISRR